MPSWRVRRQLIILLIFATPLAVVTFWAFSKFLPEASCTDNRKNQEELGVDCGGPCGPCELKDPKPVALYWTRVVPVRENSYDIAVEIENVNEVLSSADVEYEFTLRDNLGPIATRRGKTFLFAQERMHIIESNLVTTRKPTNAEFKIRDIKWEFRKEPKLNIVVLSREYKVTDFNGKKKSTVEAVLLSRTPATLKVVEVSAILLDQQENLLGTSKIIVENFLPESRQTVKFLWPEELKGSVNSVIIEPRVNIFSK